MNLAPATIEELAAEIHAARDRIARVDLSKLSSVLEHTPEDMTATVQCGITLATFQAALAPHRQWVPLDPAYPETLTVGEILAHDVSGPRRLGYGTAREYVIGIRAVLGSGEIIRNGGKVVKNVAGYDLCRLFIGARNTLGIIVEATFKLRPLPETETVLGMRCNSLRQAFEAAGKLHDPLSLDLHNVSDTLTLVASFAGTREDVERQELIARQAGFNLPADFNYDRYSRGFHKLSVLPSETFSRLEGLGPVRFVARLGNGIIYHEGPPETASPGSPRNLMARVKAAYDPRNILPEYNAQ